MTTSPWTGIRWIGLGVILFLVGFVWSWVAVRQVRLALYAKHYVAADFEVTRFIGKPRNSTARCWIEGVIQPGGEQVVTSDLDVAIKRFIVPGNHTRNEPLPEEIEGQHLAVAYWPLHAEVKRWWYPPAVVSPGEIRDRVTVARNVLLSAAVISLALFCLRQGVRHVKSDLKSLPTIAE